MFHDNYDVDVRVHNDLVLPDFGEDAVDGLAIIHLNFNEFAAISVDG